jgi:hypothetical protein
VEVLDDANAAGPNLPPSYAEAAAAVAAADGPAVLPVEGEQGGAAQGAAALGAHGGAEDQPIPGGLRYFDNVDLESPRSNVDGSPLRPSRLFGFFKKRS